MDSIERLVRKNAFELSGMFGFEPGNTVYTRLNRIALSDGMVGFALDALKEGFFGEQGPASSSSSMRRWRAPRARQ